MKRVYAGIRATGRLHLGNYLGAIKGMIELVSGGQYDCIFQVVDLHTITTPYNPKTLQQDIHEVVLDYLGAGLPINKCHLTIQSYVPEHVLLSYLLGTIYPVSRLEDLPTYKEKKELHPKYINMGLLYYPVLMAADILVYKGEKVPVGNDQEPHLEVSREIARKFNQTFGSTFPEPTRFATKAGYVPSLLGEGKMSKSIEGSYINLTDDLETIKSKLAKAPTDIGKGENIPQEGGVAALLTFVELFEGKEKRAEYEKRYQDTGIRYQELKDKLADAIFKELKPIQEKRKYYQDHPEIVEKILEEGRVYCLKIAQETLKEVKQKMGLI
ncbi:MAG: tryptophan--tRNA ligase [Candidatus Gottesmanbacteria bacterium]